MRRALLALAALCGFALPGAASGQTVLRAVMHSDLKIIDPVWTTALISAHHGYLVYDTLFSLDEKLVVRPQMVDKWEVSPDKLTYVFTLREGLEWHDGTPVTAADCVASLKRWAARDSTGQTLMSFVAELTAPDDKTMRMMLREPFGLVIEALGKTGGNVAFMMPRRVAETDPNKQITDATGSGPFIFKRDEWKAGEKAVYVKNPRYRPRNEPPSGFSGGKVAKVDRIEWIWIADTQTQVNALLNGEVDLIEAMPYDLLPLVEKDKNVRVQVIDKAGRQYILRFNTLLKPFDNARVRQAVVYAMRQKPFLEANVGDSRFYRECKSLFPCGLPLESSKGWDERASFWPRQAMTARRSWCCTRPTWSTIRTSLRWPSRCSRRRVSRSTCRRWTGRRWFRAAPRRIRRRRAAGTSSSPRRVRSASPIQWQASCSTRRARSRCTVGRATPKSRS